MTIEQIAKDFGVHPMTLQKCCSATRWLREPTTEADLVAAYRANALFDAHHDDPEFGHRFLADEARDVGEAMADRTAWRICRDNAWWSVFGKKRGRNGKMPGPAVHDGLCTVTDENGRDPARIHRRWPESALADRYHRAQDAEGTLYPCAVKDVFSSRIVGYSIDSRMKSSLAINALENAIAMRGDVAAVWSTGTEVASFEAGSSCAL